MILKDNHLDARNPLDHDGREGIFYIHKLALNIGYTEPFIYSGWENIFAPLDETMNSYGR